MPKTITELLTSVEQFVNWLLSMSADEMREANPTIGEACHGILSDIAEYERTHDDPEAEE